MTSISPNRAFLYAAAIKKIEIADAAPIACFALRNVSP